MPTEPGAAPMPLDVMRAYVTGDAAEPDLFSGLKGLDRHHLRVLLQTHRRELEEINEARSVILESIL